MKISPTEAARPPHPCAFFVVENSLTCVTPSVEAAFFLGCRGYYSEM